MWSAGRQNSSPDNVPAWKRSREILDTLANLQTADNVGLRVTRALRCFLTKAMCAFLISSRSASCYKRQLWFLIDFTRSIKKEKKKKAFCNSSKTVLQSRTIHYSRFNKHFWVLTLGISYVQCSGIKDKQDRGPHSWELKEKQPLPQDVQSRAIVYSVQFCDLTPHRFTSRNLSKEAVHKIMLKWILIVSWLLTAR